jgi:hypothetical protein
MKNKFDKNLFNQKWLVAAICLIEVLVFIAIVKVRFENNDDTAMNLIASGSLTGNPSELLIFTNVSVGYLLKWLYSATSGINWYTWYLIASFYLGYFAIQFQLSKIVLQRNHKFIMHLFLLLLLLPSLQYLQFTRVAAVVLLGGFSMILISFHKNRISYLVAVLIILLGASIRIHVFYIYCLLILPFLILPILRKEYYKIKFLGVAIIAVFSMEYLNKQVYVSNPAWNNFQQINFLRSRVTQHDNLNFKYENVKSVIDKCGWTFDDFEMASNFNYDVGIDKFSPENLKKIYKESNTLNNISSIRLLFEKLKLNITGFVEYIIGRSYICLLILFFIILLLKRSWLRIGMAISYLLYVIFSAWLLTILADINTEKERVIWSMVLPFFALLLTLPFSSSPIFDRWDSFKSIRFSKVLDYALFLVIFFCMFIGLNDIIRQEKADTNYSPEVSKFLDNQPYEFYVSWCGNEAESVFSMPQNYKKAYFLGWYVGSPFNLEKLKNYTGKTETGLYSIKNKEIVWYFRNDGYYYDVMRYHEKMQNFYKSNFKDCKITERMIPLNSKDTIFQYNVFVPN